MKDVHKYYEDEAVAKLRTWQLKVSKRPSLTNKLTKRVQDKINRLIPEKFHEIVTGAIKLMVKGVLLGSEYITAQPLSNKSLMEREDLIKKRFKYYKSSAVASGAGTGAGGFLLSLADFPILLSIKMKYLFDVASLYGFDVKNYKERLFILYVFQLAFSSGQRRLEVYDVVSNWEKYSKKLPEDLESFDWREFQQEYRDYIDLAKMLQMIPGFGAAFGAVANYRLMEKLYKTSMNSYRLRMLDL